MSDSQMCEHGQHFLRCTHCGENNRSSGDFDTPLVACIRSMRATGVSDAAIAEHYRARNSGTFRGYGVTGIKSLRKRWGIP